MATGWKQDGEDHAESAASATEWVVGRDETPRTQWQQATLIGVLFNLLIAPAYGFPLISVTHRFDTFFVAIVLVSVVFVVVARRLRANRAVRRDGDRITVVQGPSRTSGLIQNVTKVRYEPKAKKLELVGLDLSLDLPPRLGYAVVRRFQDGP